MQKPKMMIGEKGVKYGLIKTGPKPAGGAAKPLAAPRPSNVFGDDESDEDVEAQVQRQAEKKRANSKVQQQYEAALAEDPSAFDYDGVYDQIKADSVAPQQQEKVERKSRYIAQLKDQAERRKREDEVVQERRMLKDRVKEDHLFEDKEVFVTGNYRKKLEEQKLWAEQEKAREAEEERLDVRKVGHMGNFYANLLNKNVAFGGAVASKTTDEPKDEAKAQAQEGASVSQPDAKPEPNKNGSDDSSSDDDDKPSIAEAAAKAGVQLDKYDLIRMEAERSLKARKAREQAQGKEQDGDGAREEQGARAQASSQPRASPASVLEKDSGAPPGPASESAAAASASGKRRNDDSSAQAARERFLARKKQHGGA